MPKVPPPHHVLGLIKEITYLEMVCYIKDLKPIFPRKAPLNSFINFHWSLPSAQLLPQAVTAYPPLPPPNSVKHNRIKLLSFKFIH